MNASNRKSAAALPAGLDLGPGRPGPLGATPDAGGVNFAVFSAHAEAIELCLFDESGAIEIGHVALPERDGDIWHGHVAGLRVGARYGFRAHGPWSPAEGQRFNAQKLLLDPYARGFDRPLVWAPAQQGAVLDRHGNETGPDPRDSAAVMAKSLVMPLDLGPLEDRPARRPPLIFEAHLRGLTMRHPEIPPDLRGTPQALAAAPILDHLIRLGVTVIELLPVQAFFDDRHLVERGLRNFWGYQTLGFFAPEPRYLGAGGLAGLRAMVRRFHEAGIEVILDVVYNHSGEGDHAGPTLCFRGLDNLSYYRLIDGGARYVNDTGTGNTLNIGHPMVLRMVTESLRYWVEVIGVDGFRFDLAATLTRDDAGFEPGSAFLAALMQDPVLSRVRLIAEPWDIGPGGYRLGHFPHPFSEWNDRFRDGVRRFWRGDGGAAADLAKRLLGSAEVFDHGGRGVGASVNFLTSHDGFTLQDVVSYTEKSNHDNGEDNRDGHHENISDNLGAEGPSDDPAILAARAARKRAMLATLFFAQGTPMLLAGDEIANSQGGNNNAYAQDNETGWTDWPGADRDLADFVARLSGLRRALPLLRQECFLHGRIRAEDGLRDLIWRRPDGAEPTAADWHDPDWRMIGVEIRGNAEGPEGACGGAAAFVVFNAGPAGTLHLPAGRWHLRLDSSRPAAEEDAPGAAVRGPVMMAAQSVLLFSRDDATG